MKIYKRAKGESNLLSTFHVPGMVLKVFIGLIYPYPHTVTVVTNPMLLMKKLRLREPQGQPASKCQVYPTPSSHSCYSIMLSQNTDVCP